MNILRCILLLCALPLAASAARPHPVEPTPEERWTQLIAAFDAGTPLNSKAYIGRRVTTPELGVTASDTELWLTTGDGPKAITLRIPKTIAEVRRIAGVSSVFVWARVTGTIREIDFEHRRVLIQPISAEGSK